MRPLSLGFKGWQYLVQASVDIRDHSKALNTFFCKSFSDQKQSQMATGASHLAESVVLLK